MMILKRKFLGNGVLLLVQLKDRYIVILIEQDVPYEQILIDTEEMEDAKLIFEEF